MSITQSYFLAPEDVRLNSIHFLITEIHSKKELQSIAYNHSIDINYQDFMNIYRTYIYKPYSCLSIDATLLADNSLRFRKNL